MASGNTSSLTYNDKRKEVSCQRIHLVFKNISYIQCIPIQKHCNWSSLVWYIQKWAIELFLQNLSISQVWKEKKKQYTRWILFYLLESILRIMFTEITNCAYSFPFFSIFEEYDGFFYFFVCYTCELSSDFLERCHYFYVV